MSSNSLSPLYASANGEKLPGSQLLLAGRFMSGSIKSMSTLNAISLLVLGCICPTCLTAITPQLGSKKVIVMRVDFPDMTNSAPSMASVSNAMLSVSSFYQSNSFNQLSITSTVISALRLPKNSRNYLNISGMEGLSSDAFAAARAIGYDPANYDYDIVTFTNIGFGFAGFATIGGRGLWLQIWPGGTFTASVVAHELGHNFGLGHAHAWVSPSVIGSGSMWDTGNLFDAMASAQYSLGSSHFNSNSKFLLGWIPTNCIQIVSSSGSYRIYAMDGCGPLNATRKYGLVVPAATEIPVGSEAYWVECRQLINTHSTTNGVILMWGNSSSPNGSYLLDTTPGTQAGLLDLSDSPIALGRSFTDPNKRITIAPTARGGTGADKFFDIQVTLNSPLEPPAITKQPSPQTVPAGFTAVLSVAGTSSLPVNYQWLCFGSSVVGATNAVLVLTNVSMAQSGDYMVVLSNSLGSIASSLASLTVTSPPPPSCYPLPQDMVAWWPADGHPLDWIGTNHAVLEQTASHAQGKVGQAFALNGSTDFLQAPSSPLWALGTNNFTIELWANFSVVGGDRALVACDSGGGMRAKWIFWLNDGQLRLLALNNLGAAAFSPSIGQWYHLAVTRLGSLFSFYINGNVVSTATSTETIPDAKVPLTIGMAEGTMFFGGLLDDVRIYQRALSASEIVGIYTSGSAGICWPSNPPSLVRFSGSATTIQESVSNVTIGLSRVGNTASTVTVGCISSNGTALANVNYTPSSGTIVFNPDETGKSLTVGILNDSVAGGTKQFTMQLISPSSNAVLGNPATDTVSIADNGCLPPLPGLLAWWTGNGSADDLVSTNDGLLQNSAGYVPGKVGAGFLLDGAGGYVSIPFSSSVDFKPSNQMSICAWVQALPRAQYQAIIVKCPFEDAWDWGLYLDPSGHFMAGFHNNAVVSSTTTVVAGTWYFVCVTYSSGNWTLFVNGNPQASATGRFLLQSSGGLAIGRKGQSLPNSDWLQGVVDEVQIYNRSLTSSEIQAVYSMGSQGMCPPSPPVFTIQPQSQTVKAGANVTFMANADGFTPLNYQWLFNGTNLAGEAGNSLGLVNVQMTNAGNYSVVVRNIAGSITSTNAMLRINPALPASFESIKALRGGAFELVINGELGSFNTLEFSTNLFDWQVAGNFPVMGIPTTLTNKPAGNNTKGFYRTLGTRALQ